MARRAGRLHDQHAPAPAGQGPRRGEAEQPRPHHDALAVVGHTPIIRRGAGGASWPEGPAVRSAAVTSGMDVSTHPTHDTTPGDSGDAGDPERRGESEDRPLSAVAADQGRVGRGLRTVGFHAVALACFTVPAVVLWWHVWSGHPSATLTCGCGDPAQEVWFMAWPAWAIAHLHSLLFSGVVERPDGANLLSNTSGPLVGVVLAPVTWLFGPVASTNVALTLAPALSAWACFAAIRPLVSWKAGAIPAALVFGYSSAIVTSVAFGHVSVTVLVIPPFLFTTLYEIVIRQEHRSAATRCSWPRCWWCSSSSRPRSWRCACSSRVAGLVVVAAVGWRRGAAGGPCPAGPGRRRRPHRGAAGLPGLVRAGRGQAVTGVLFALAPISGVPLSGLLVPGGTGTGQRAIRFGGYSAASGRRPTRRGGRGRGHPRCGGAGTAVAP